MLYKSTTIHLLAAYTHNGDDTSQSGYVYQLALSYNTPLNLLTIALC